MSKLLSDELKESLCIVACDDYFSARPQIDSIDRRRVFEAGFARATCAIEAAVLEAQGRQEPVGLFIQGDRGWYETECGNGTPLYAAPVVQPDMVLVPRKPTEAMMDALWKARQDNYLTTVDVWLVLIAAAEGKE